MDTRTGKIIAPDELEDILSHMDPDQRKYIKKMNLNPTARQQRKKKIGRNDLCPCGSGKKFKKCCLV